jgi:uncharacterized RDD family membrane protein YckC
MNWYYADQGQQVGPVEDAELAQLEQTGKINDETLVWRAGLEDWLPYREVKPKAAHSLSTPPPAPTRPAPISTEVVCTECGNIFPAEETIRHGEARLCARCKPIFLQKLAEGAHFNSRRFEVASVLTRFAAVFLDGLILGAINFGLTMAAGLVGIVGARASTSMEAASTGVVLVQLVLFAIMLFAINMAIGIGYEVFFIGKYGATLGKMACKIKVVDPEGNPISYGRAFGRYFAKILSSLTCMIGYIMACFDSENRALHDRICNTRVIKN